MTTYKFSSLDESTGYVNNFADETHESIGSAVWSISDYLEGEYEWVESEKVSDEPECVELFVRGGLTLDGVAYIEEFRLFVEPVV